MLTKQKNSFVKGFKFRIYPNTAQQEQLAKTFGSCRYLWNKVLAATQAEHQAYLFAKENATDQTTLITPNLSSNGLCYRVPIYRNNPETAWMKQVSSVALQQTMVHLGMAYDRFFKSLKTTRAGKYGKPKFKKKTSKQSFTAVGNAFRLKDKQLFLAKIDEPISVLWTRELPAEPTSLTISMTPKGEYFVSFTCEYFPIKTSGAERIGIDVGIKTYATLSNGEKLENPKWLKQHLEALKRAQQTLSRRKKGSSNSRKARLKVASLHQKVSDSRHDWQHKVTRTLVNENQVIGVEGLKVANMIRNRKLSKAIQDASWSSFFAKLNYKVRESQHSTLVYLGTFYPSSHICNVTGKKLGRKLDLSEREWLCPFCGNAHDRDLNAAVNIENKAVELYNEVSQRKDLAGQVYVIS